MEWRHGDSGRFFVPGRIEVLGKHTDYAGGRSLLAAIDRGFHVTVTRGDDGRIRVTDRTRAETVILEAPPAPGRRPPWSIYPETAVRRAAGDFDAPLRGCDIVFESDLPPAAGLSSSSALIVAVFLALDAVSGLSDGDPEALATYLAAVERGDDARPGVGTRGGGEDHTAILCGEEGRLVRYAFEPTRREGSVAMPAGYVFAVGCSGVAAEKAGAARERYNRLGDLAARAAELWRRHTGGDARHLGAILGRGAPARSEGPSAGDLLVTLHDALRQGAPAGERDALWARARHFVAESEEIVPAAFVALEAHDLEGFSTLVDRSQALAEELLGNQVPETIHLARSARALGAAAASAFGAGFGGAVWAMVREAEAEAFLDAWSRDCAGSFPDRASAMRFFATPAAGPARRL